MPPTAPCLLPIASNLAKRSGHGIRRYISVRAHQESSDLQRSSRRRVRKSPNTDKEWISVIGLEVHAQIATNTKLFSGAVNDPRGSTNSLVSLLDASIPGTLPVLNRGCVEAGIRTALALGSRINLTSTFDRKHYFYSDLPTGYQITQLRRPLANGGVLTFPVLSWSKDEDESYYHSSEIVQLQLEQDSGKSLHDEDVDQGSRSLIDLNRCGVGLMEIVFAPDLYDGEQAVGLVRELSLILRSVGSCSCAMEDGALRVDANISVMPSDSDQLGVRTEVKNINSLRNVQGAIEAEVDRQIRIIESGGVVENETRGFDVNARLTVPMRDKEVKQDYRFMPEPNLPPLRLRDSGNSDDSNANPNILNVDDYRQEMAPLPAQTRSILVNQHQLGLAKAARLLEDPDSLKVFLEVMQIDPSYPGICADYILSELEFFRKKFHLETVIGMALTPSHLAEACRLRADDRVGVNLITDAMSIIMEDGANNNGVTRLTLDKVVSDRGWYESGNEDRVRAAVDEGVSDHTKLVGKYVRGNSKGFSTILKNILKKHPDVDVLKVKQVLLKTLEDMKAKN